VPQQGGADNHLDYCNVRETEFLSDAKPCARRAQGLALSVDLGLCDTLQYLVDVAKNTLNDNLKPHYRKISQLRSQLEAACGRLPSAAFCLNSRLEIAMRVGDVPTVRHCLRAILDLEYPRTTPKVHCLFDGTFGRSFEEFYVSVFTKEFAASFPYPFDGSRPTDEIKSLEDLRAAQEALRMLEPALYAELVTYVTDFMVLASSHMHAASSYRAFGLISLRQQQPIDYWTVYLEHIIHEAAHLHLFAVWKHETLVLNSPTERFESPLRPDPRPMSGIFHAMFVLARISYIYNRFSRDQRFIKHAERWATAHNSAKNKRTPAEKFRDAFDTVMTHGRLSPVGRRIAESCRELVSAGE
jgi:hypothetical protein